MIWTVVVTPTSRRLHRAKTDQTGRRRTLCNQPEPKAGWWAFQPIWSPGGFPCGLCEQVETRIIGKSKL